MGYEKFVMDADFCAALHVWMRGLPLDDNALALDAFREVGPGKHFFGCGPYARQLRNRVLGKRGRRQQLLRAMARRGDEGCAGSRAAERCKRLIAEYDEPKLDPAVDEELGRLRQAPKGGTAGPMALAALSTVVIAFETEAEAKARLEAFGYAPEIAGEQAG